MCGGHYSFPMQSAKAKAQGQVQEEGGRFISIPPRATGKRDPASGASPPTTLSLPQSHPHHPPAAAPVAPEGTCRRPNLPPCCCSVGLSVLLSVTAFMAERGFAPAALASSPSGLGGSRLSSSITCLKSQTQLTDVGVGTRRETGALGCVRGSKGKLTWRWDAEPAVENVCE